MITPEDIKLQLMANLPQYTEEYSEKVEATGIVSGTTVAAIEKTSHGLTTGDVITCSSAKAFNPIVSVSYDAVSGEATITTTYEHDLTSGTGDKGGANVATLTGFADSNYVGDFAVISATRTTFNIAQDADVVGDLGSLEEDRNLFLGFLQVTVVNVNNFTVSLSDTQLPDATVLPTFNYVTSQRIFIVADVTRAVTIWGQKRDRKPTLFIVMGVETASKDRNTVNDSIISATSQNPVQVTYMMEATLKTVANTKAEQSAATQMQHVYSEIRTALRQSMFGHVFNSTDTAIVFAAIEISNSPEFWNQNNYVHNFDYQMPYKITIEQGITNKHHVSFREVIVSSKMFDNEGDLVELTTEPTI